MFVNEVKEGVWVKYLANWIDEEEGYKEATIVGWIEDPDPNMPIIRAVRPKEFFMKPIKAVRYLIEKPEDDMKPEDIDTLIDIALSIKDEEWFNQLCAMKGSMKVSGGAGE